MYFKPTIDEQGIKVPDYTSIRDYLLSEFKRIFGNDLYLGTDSQDYQMISLFAMALDDANALAIESYNNRNPDYARGNALDMLLPLNGLTRIGATHSTATLELSGEPGATIAAGSVATDFPGNRWILQTSSEIDASGKATVDARAEKSGRIVAGVGAINQIATPTAGWVSVTNPQEAVPGRDTETDAELRARRIASVESLSVGVTQAMLGALLKVSDVSGVVIYENATGTTDTNGIPAHSICVVVLGGDNEDIARTIYAKKSPGCGLYGDVEKSIVDVFGNTVTIKFMRPVQKSVAVDITVRAFAGYSTETATNIVEAVAEHICGLKIGETLETGLLWGVVAGQNPSSGGALFSPTSILTGIVGDTKTSSPIVPAFNEILVCSEEDITVTLE